MKLGGKTVLLCDCERSMPLDGKAIAKACGAEDGGTLNTQLCRAQIDTFKQAAAGATELIVACTQEAPYFEESLADLAEAGSTPPATRYVNIRERAGWSKQANRATPKIAALLAEATLEVPAAPSLSIVSEGVCLVYGRDEQAIAAAKQLAGHLDVTVLLKAPQSVPPPQIMDVPIFKGTISAAQGHVGAFELMVDDYAPLIVSSRQALTFEAAKNGAASRCDLILDLTGEAALFPAAEKRDGYFNPDPGNPGAVQRALFDLIDLVGEFEKPIYVDFEAALCAHSRSRLTGCTRCLDVCPAAAIQPAGDTVKIDAYLCGGCGGCNSVCPTGAASYSLPPNETLLARVDKLLDTYRAGGGRRPVLLVHDEAFGNEMMSLVARFGGGLPAEVLPFAVNEATQIGFDFLAGALAKGAAQILILVPPTRRGELAGLAAQIGIAEALVAGLGYGAGRVQTIDEQDPEAFEQLLYQLPAQEAAAAAPYQAAADKRTRQRQALQHLHAVAPQPTDYVFLPPGAPFGRVKVEVEGCTLCLACVSACPTGALVDNPDLPQLRFREDACIQCGLCKATCPESVISLEPRLNFTAQATEALLVKEEEPFHCVKCGKPFGTKSSIERIVERLAEKHSMFQDQAAIDRIRMCQDCRVVSQFDVADNPLAGGARPAMRTTDDYLREREEIEQARAAFKAEDAKQGKQGDEPT